MSARISPDVGIRLDTLAENKTSPSKSTSKAPGAPIRIFDSTPNRRSISCFRLTACCLISDHMKQRLISIFIGSNPAEEVFFLVYAIGRVRPTVVGIYEDLR
jgi:hypothetical protein